MRTSRPAFRPVPPSSLPRAAPGDAVTTPAPAASKLTPDARRSLALLAGGDLDPAAAAAARGLADDCPHCRGHLGDVRGGLAALRSCEAADHGGGLWPAVRDGLGDADDAAGGAVEVAAAPAAGRWAMPAFAVTAAALLVGAFAWAPVSGHLPWSDGPSAAPTPVGEEQYLPPRRPDAPALRPARPAPVDRFGRPIPRVRQDLRR